MFLAEVSMILEESKFGMGTVKTSLLLKISINFKYKPLILDIFKKLLCICYP